MLKVKVCAIFLISMIVLAAGAAAQTARPLKTIIVDAGHGGKDFGAHGGYEGGLNSYEKNITLGISLKLVAELKKQLPDVKIIPTRTTDIYQSPPEKADIANENKGDLFICIHADAVALQTGRRQVGTRQETRYKVTGKKKKRKSTPYTVTVPVYEYYKIGSKRSGTSMWLFAAHKTEDKTKAVMKNEAAMAEEEIEIGSGADSTLNEIDFSAPEYKMMAGVHASRFQQKSIKLASFINSEIDETERPGLGIYQRAKGIWVLQATNMPAVLVETGFITNHDDERYLNSDKGQQELAECITRAVKRYKEQLEGNKGNTAPAADSKAEAKVLKEATAPKYSDRSKNVLKKINVTQPAFKVDLYDDGDVDGDIVSVYYNGKQVVDNKRLTDKPLSLNLSTDASRAENELVIYAENEGDIAPNTALMIVSEGDNRTEVRISSDTKKNGVVLFSKK